MGRFLFYPATTRLASGGVRRTTRPARTVTPMPTYTPDDDFTEWVTRVVDAYPTPEAGPVKPSRPRQPEPVIQFARGTFWWLANLILLYVLLWLLLHG
jgi:hypothetical protein